jgi:hypothetical protein
MQRNQVINNELGAQQCELNGKYFITPTDLDELSIYGEDMPVPSTDNDVPSPLTIDEKNKFCMWYDGNDGNIVQPLEQDDVDTIAYMRATTVKCPSCGVLSGTHYHGKNCYGLFYFVLFLVNITNFSLFQGHACYHVKDGCFSCKMEFCYRCLSTEAENIKDRGSKEMCKYV